MGTEHYLLRPDNGTVYELGTAWHFRDYLRWVALDIARWSAGKPFVWGGRTGSRFIPSGESLDFRERAERLRAELLK